jgi:low affinity Fe/Cu permease
MRTRLVALPDRVSELAGHPFAAMGVFAFVALWALLGPPLHFSATWITAIQVASAIVTIVMVFALQNAQNRHTMAMQIKLNELLRAVEGAREHEFVDLETKDELEQAEIRKTQLQDYQGRLSIAEQEHHHAVVRGSTNSGFYEPSKFRAWPG